jgi:hypothetical protein
MPAATIPQKEESTVASNIDSTQAIEVTDMTLATIPPKEESAVLPDIADTARDVGVITMSTSTTPATEEFSEPINTTGTRAVEETTMSSSNNPPTGKSAVPLSTTGTGAVDDTKLNTLPSEESIVSSTTGGTQDTEETTMPGAPADTPGHAEEEPDFTQELLQAGGDPDAPLEAGQEVLLQSQEDMEGLEGPGPIGKTTTHVPWRTNMALTNILVMGLTHLAP